MGIYERQPIQFEEVSTAITFQGMGEFNTSTGNHDVNLQWESKGIGDSVVISYPELSLNQTEAQVINLVKRKFDVVKNSLVAKTGEVLYGLGTGMDMDGLQLQTDDGTYTSAYGGLARSTYGAVINGQLTPVSGGVISFTALASQIDLCSAAASRMESTNLILTTKSVWSLVEKLVEAKSRGNYDTSRGNLRTSPYTPMGVAVNAQDAGRIGYEAYYFRGIPTVKDDQCTSGVAYTLNENHIQMVGLKIAYCEPIKMAQEVTKGALEEVVTTAWQVSKESKATGALGDVRQIITYGNVVNRNPVRSGAMTGITTS